jgi:hypothetical protein
MGIKLMYRKDKFIMKKYIFTCLFLIGLCNVTILKAQCKLNKWNDDSNVFLQTKFEEVYKNDDLENGLLTFEFSQILAAKKDDLDKVKYFMQIKASVLRPKSGPIPVKISFNFESGESVTVEAESHEETKYVGRVKIETSLYRLNGKIIDLFSSSGIKSITLYDKNTGTSITITPNRFCIKNHWDCILKDYEKL